jgi:hypothetical protein
VPFFNTLEKIAALTADARRQTSPPGCREKLSDRIYRMVRDLFFFRKALMNKP